MRRIAGGDVLSDEDCDELVGDILAAREFAAPRFELDQLAKAESEDVPVCLVSIEGTEHVNALESQVPLTFEPSGLTIVYGDNGTGKSGYARLLKRITRARHQEDVLTDVFRDTSLEKPTARLSVRVGDEEVPLDWPDSSRAELQRILFYDAACGDAYIASDSDFPYRPSALFVMDGLIEACVAVRERLDAKLAENARQGNEMPAPPEPVRDTDAGKFLTSLAASSTVEALARIIHEGRFSRRFSASRIECKEW